jgi:hypothetical protein
MKDFNMEDLTNDDSSSDYQYVEDIDNTDIDDNIVNLMDLMDVEEYKIDILIKNLYYFRDRLDKFHNEPLENINTIRKDFYLLCENDRYLIDDSFFIQNLEKTICNNISYYEDKLFKVYEELVIEQDYIDLKIETSNKIENERKLIHERMIYGDKLQKESRTENIAIKSCTEKMELTYNKYNNIYQISEFDRLKEKYHILYDTEENIVEYIINAYI